MRLDDVKLISSVLCKELGWSWPLSLLRSLANVKTVLNGTSWAEGMGAEAAYAKRLSITVALYQDLTTRVGRERAFEIMREIVVPASVNDMRKHFDSLGISGKEGMERLLAFWDNMDRGRGMGQVNQGAFARRDDHVLYYVCTNCFYARFYQEVGTPELTRLLCESDNEFWPYCCPDFEFHRGDSWENTIAYGREQCDFIFERKR